MRGPLIKDHACSGSVQRGKITATSKWAVPMRMGWERYTKKDLKTFGDKRMGQMKSGKPRTWGLSKEKTGHLCWTIQRRPQRKHESGCPNWTAWRSQGRRDLPDLGNHTAAQLNKMHLQIPGPEAFCGTGAHWQHQRPTDASISIWEQERLWVTPFFRGGREIGWEK